VATRFKETVFAFMLPVPVHENESMVNAATLKLEPVAVLLESLMVVLPPV
jgi:hypothetical protein